MKCFAMIGILLAACGDDHPATDATPAGDTPVVTDVNLPANTWTWLDVPGNVCANGTQTGIGINMPANPSNELFVYFEGGGACWDYSTCFDLKTSVNIETNYDKAKFMTDVPNAMADRSAGNVFANSILVWVGYCTGDLHAGIETRDYTSGPTTKTVHHAGATNTQHIVDFLHGIVPNAQKIWIGGSSAGGYGATFNHHRFASAWPTVDVHLMQDSSPYLPVLAAYSTWQTAWSLQFPPNCTDCTTSLPNVVDTIAAAHPSSRIALMHYDDDAVIKQYFGYAATAGSLVPATDAMLANHYNHPSTHAFVIAGSSHTMFGQIGTLTGPGGVSLAGWLGQWATGDAAWTTVR